MADQAEDKVQETPIEEANAEPEAEVAAEVPQEETTEQPKEETPETVEEEPELTPGQQERVEEAKAKGMDPVRLEKLIANMTRPREQQAPERPQALDYRTAIDADDEVVNALESDRQAFGANLYNQGLAQANAIEFRTMLEIDAPRVESKYPQLDQSSDQFDSQAANDINTLYLSLVGYDAQSGAAKNKLRYRDFVDAFMATTESLATKKAAETGKNIAKQSAQTAIRPSGQGQKLNLTKPASEMTDEELKAINDRLVKQLQK